MENTLADLFLQWNSGLEGAALGLAALSAVMTFLKSNKVAQLLDFSCWEAIPEWGRSFVPLVLGGFIGAVEVAITGGVPGDLAAGFASGFVLIGGAQTLLYQSAKSTPVGNFISGLLNTYHEKAELTAAKAAAAKPSKKKK